MKQRGKRRFFSRLFFNAGPIGLGLTLLVLFADRHGYIRSLELFLEDFRAAHFQQFKKPPTDQLIHLDIDDPSIKFAGKWPWPRQNFAKILDELNLAGAKTVAMDVTFTDPSPLTAEKAGDIPIDNDTLFAEAIMRFGKESSRHVLLSSIFDFSDATGDKPRFLAMVQELTADLELNDAELLRRIDLAHGELTKVEPDESINDLIDSARREATFVRIKQELDHDDQADLESLRKKLLPNSEGTGIRGQSWHLLKDLLPVVQSYIALFGNMMPVPPGAPPFWASRSEDLPIPAIARASGFAASTHFWDMDDATVRSAPLFILDRDRLVPQMGLAMACAQLGINIRDLRISSNNLTIPLPNGKSINIPVSTQKSATGEAGMMMDIPWFGTSKWWTMYDWPDHKKVSQHLSAASVWDICVIGPDILENNRNALDAVIILKSVEVADEARQLRTEHPPFADTEAWNKLMTDALDGLPPGTLNAYKGYLDGSKDIDSITDPTERNLVLSIRVAQQRMRLNQQLITQRGEERAELRSQVQGKAVLVGWVASGAMDFRATPLHKECPGVVMHGAIFNAIMTGDFKRRVPDWLSPASTIAAGLLITLASAALRPRGTLLTALLLAGAFIWVDFSLLYDRRGLEVEVAGPVVAAIIVAYGCELTRLYRLSSLN